MTRQVASFTLPDLTRVSLGLMGPLWPDSGHLWLVRGPLLQTDSPRGLTWGPLVFQGISLVCLWFPWSERDPCGLIGEHICVTADISGLSGAPLA